MTELFHFKRQLKPRKSRRVRNLAKDRNCIHQFSEKSAPSSIDCTAKSLLSNFQESGGLTGEFHCPSWSLRRQLLTGYKNPEGSRIRTVNIGSNNF